jgi:hypothetical protein
MKIKAAIYTSGYDVLDHGCHSMGLAHCVGGDRAANDENHGRGRERALISP